MNKQALSGLVVACSLWAGCGGDDEPKGTNGAARYNEIAGSIANPTGTLDQDTAADVAREYEKISTSGAGGRRLLQQTGAQKISCPAGGSYSINYSGGTSSGVVNLAYHDCCYTEASCCMNGGGEWYYAVEAGAAYSYCGSYALSFSCVGIESSGAYQGCFSTSGEWTYVVTINGKTFAVEGSINNGSGTLTVTAENGSYTCKYTNYQGSCTGTSGSFSF